MTTTLKPGELHYLCTPYSRYKHGLRGAFHAAAYLAARLLEKGVHTFSPIAHSHGIADRGAIDPIDHSIWLPLDKNILTRCDALLVAHLEGWEDSAGIAAEVELAKESGLPVYDLDPVTLAATMREGA